MVILGEVGEIARFETKRALASYAGLTPSVRESAGKRKRGGIGHHGSGTLRWIMLQVAQVAARCSPAARGPGYEAEAAKTGTGGADRTGPQAAHRGLGAAPPWSLLRRERLRPKRHGKQVRNKNHL